VHRDRNIPPAPDARWRLKISDLAVMASLQRAILRSAAEIVKPGGLLVYSTCSLEPEENDAQIDRFPRRASGVALGSAARGSRAAGRARRRTTARSAAAPRDRRRVCSALAEKCWMSFRTSLRRSLPYAVTIIGGFLLAYLIVAFPDLPVGRDPGQRERCPNVGGLLFDDASKRLAAVGFKAARGDEEYREATPPARCWRSSRARRKGARRHHRHPHRQHELGEDAVLLLS
jgi:hypothetical protein